MEIKTCEQYVLDQLEQAERDWLRGKLEQAQDEAEELRGKPADECPDGPRYKAVGNSMAVPVMRWIGERIAMAEAGEIS